MQVSGHPAVAPHMTKFYGIRNGIDQDIWDPLEDRFLPRSAQGAPSTPGASTCITNNIATDTSPLSAPGKAGVDFQYRLPLLCRSYGVEDAAAGKAAAKAELRRRMELSSADVPLVAVITRLTHQKGIHLIKHAAWRALERGAQFVLLGSAPDPRVQVTNPVPRPVRADVLLVRLL